MRRPPFITVTSPLVARAGEWRIDGYRRFVSDEALIGRGESHADVMVVRYLVLADNRTGTEGRAAANLLWAVL